MAKIILYISALSAFFPVVIGLKNIMSVKEKGHLSLFFYLVVSLVLEIILYFSSKNGINNLPLLHLFTLIEFGLISLLYKGVFSFSRSSNIIFGVGIVFILIDIFCTIYAQGLYEYNSYVRGIESFIFTVYALFYFYQIFVESKIVRLEKHPFFWFNSGMLLYFSGNLFLFLLSNMLLQTNPEMLNNFWIIHSMLNLFMNFSFTIGLWLTKQK